MPAVSSPPTYRAVLALPGAAYSFAIATVGRLAYGVVGLPLLFVIEGTSDSVPLAGTALAAFGLATLTAPLKSRLMDRVGQPRVLGCLGTLFPLPLLVLSFWAADLVVRPVILVGVAAVAGVLTPPLGPAMRFLWSRMAPDADLKRRAYAVDAIVEEVLYIVGPAIAGLFIAFEKPDVALALTAAMAFAGTVGLAVSRACRSYGISRSTDVERRCVKRRLWGPPTAKVSWLLLAIMLGVGAAVGAVEIAVAAKAAALGSAEIAGYALACMAFGSVIGAMTWGRLKHRRGVATQLVFLIGVLAAGITLAALTAHISLVWTGALVAASSFHVALLGVAALLLVLIGAAVPVGQLAKRTGL